MKTLRRPLIWLLLITFSFVLFGCGGGGGGGSNPVAPVVTGAPQGLNELQAGGGPGSVRMLISGLLAAEGAASPTIGVTMTIIDPANQASPTRIVQATATATLDGKAQADFADVPVGTVIADVVINDGSVNGETKLHGAADVLVGQVTQILPEPVGSKGAGDVLVAVLKRWQATPADFPRFKKEVAGRALKAILGVNLQDADVYEKAYAAFLGYQESVLEPFSVEVTLAIPEKYLGQGAYSGTIRPPGPKLSDQAFRSNPTSCSKVI